MKERWDRRKRKWVPVFPTAHLHQDKAAPLPFVGTTAAVLGRHARSIVKVKTGGRNMRDRWWRLTQALGVTCQFVEQAADDAAASGHWHWETWFDCWGTPEALTALFHTTNPCVIEVQYAVAGHTYHGKTSLAPMPAAKVQQGPPADHPLPAEAYAQLKAANK